MVHQIGECINWFIFLLFDGVRLHLWNAVTNGHIVHPPGDIWVWRTTVEWYWQGKIEDVREKPIPVSLCPLQIPHGLNRARTRDLAVRGRRLTAWAMARPTYKLASPWVFYSYAWQTAQGQRTVQSSSPVCFAHGWVPFKHFTRTSYPSLLHSC
jgi:hypothetical protein